MSDDLPLGSRGGTAIQHRFPVDGEYEISVDLQRGRTDEVLGTGRERKLDLQVRRSKARAVHHSGVAWSARADINTGVRPAVRRGESSRSACR